MLLSANNFTADLNQMKLNQLFLFGIVKSFLAFIPAQAAQKDETIMPEAGNARTSDSQQIVLDEKIKIILDKREKYQKEQQEWDAINEAKIFTALELELVEKLQDMNLVDTMEALVKLQANPDSALRIIELTDDKMVPILCYAIDFEIIWPLWQILQASYLKDPNKVREKVNYKVYFNEIGSRSLLESALKKCRFHAAEILLHFGAIPQVNPYLLNFLATTKRFAYLALLSVYGANLPSDFFHPVFEELKSIAATDKKLAIKITFALYGKKWQGDGKCLDDITGLAAQTNFN